MDTLDKCCLLKIIKLFNLNERTVLRLLNKKFKNLCDSIKIDKLIIFDRQPRFCDKLKFTNEEWSLDDTVYVTDLDKFMKSHSKNVDLIKKLVIISVNQGKHSFNEEFKNLEHLELYNIELTNAKILEYSCKLKNLYLHEAFFINHLTKLSISNLINCRISVEDYLVIGNHLKSIDNLEILTYRMNPFQLYFALTKLKLDIVKNLRLYPISLNLIHKLISNGFKNLKNLDTFTDDYKLLNNIIDKKKFSLSLIGIKIDDRKSFQFFVDFYEKLAFFIKECATSLIMSEENLKIFKRFDQNKLIEYYKLIDVLSTIDLPYDEKILNKMINVSELIITLANTSNLLNFEKFINLFSHVIGFKIYQIPESSDNYHLQLDSISSLKNLNKLKIALWNKIDYSFIVKMENLKYLVILSLNAIDYDLILDLFKNLKHLAFLQILFLVPDNNDYSKERLVEFKKDAITLLKNQLRFNDNIDTFKIDMIKEPKFKVKAVRIIFKRSMYVDESLTYGDKHMQEDYNRFLSAIKHRTMMVKSFSKLHI